MTFRSSSVSRRRGLTLLEVLVALGIFLSALVAIVSLISLGADIARDVQHQAQAAQLCQAKLAEVVAGVLPLSAQSDAPFDEDPDWTWSLDAQQSDIAGLWKVTVRVKRERSDGSRIECAFDRMLLDPSMRGSTLDAATIAANNAANSSSSSSSSGTGSGSSSGTSGTPNASGGAGASGAAGSNAGTGKSSGGGAAPTGGGGATSPSGAGAPKAGGGAAGNSKGGN